MGLRTLVSITTLLIMSACYPSNVCSFPSFSELTHSDFDQRFETKFDAVGLDAVAYAVIEQGEVIHSNTIGRDGEALALDTPLRFASITKALTGVILVQLNAEGILDLDASVLTYLPDANLPAEVTVRQLAAHTSEGSPGAEYVYGTQRFALIEDIIETVTDNSLEQAFRSRIAVPSGMNWYDSPSLGSHAGFVSTVSDMALFAATLQSGRLIADNRLSELTAPYPLKNGKDGPVSLGFFTQVIGDERILWSFGQDDPDHSSALFLHLPKRRLSFVLLANTDALSNPFRLMMGDLRTSAFALAFLDTYAPDIAIKIPETDRALSRILTAAWTEDFPSASKEFEQLKEASPQAFEEPDRLVLHFAAMNLQGGADPMIDAFNDRVLAAHPNNKWVLLAASGYFERTSRDDEAFLLYQRIIDLPNQEEDFLRRLFLAWAYRDQARIMMGSDLEAAAELLDKGLATGVRGETRQQLLDLKNGLAQP
ncbi:MAG: serine hydrolase domain-containing protein [Pseudomonadota bacterium]